MTERLREERAVEALAQKFTYQDIQEIPAGVNPKQLDFLRDASNVGAFMHVRPQTAKLITEYFTTEATYADLAERYSVDKSSVVERVHTGLRKLHTVLHQKKPTLAAENTYPIEQIKKGKDETQVFKTTRSRQRRSEAASKGRAKRVEERTDIFVSEPSSSH